MSDWQLNPLTAKPNFRRTARKAMAAWGLNALAQKTHNTFTDYLQTTKCIDNMKACSFLLTFFFI
jgi:hypothetical protein